jgi:hypothetical protein
MLTHHARLQAQKRDLLRDEQDNSFDWCIRKWAGSRWSLLAENASQLYQLGTKHGPTVVF